MALYKTEGIFLKRMNLGEADRILTIFTREKGKIKAVAKGVRRSKAKMAGHLERFNRSKLMIAEGKNLDTITSAELVFPFECHGSIIGIAKAYYMAELVDELVHDELPHKIIYSLIIDYLSKVEEENELLLPYFEINLLSLLGFRPELENCVICHQKLIAKDSVLAVDQGGFAHGLCYKGLGIEDDIIKVLRVFLNSDMTVIERLNLSRDLIARLQQITSLFVNQQLGKELKSRNFLREVSNPS